MPRLGAVPPREPRGITRTGSFRPVALRVGGCTARGVGSPRLGALLALLLAFQPWGCGGEEPLDDGLSRETMFKHGPPSGPAPWKYYLTCYGGPSDSSAYKHTPACGGKVVDGAWWYSTGAWSFGCHAKLELRANGKCAVVEVVDNGPAGWVEQQAAAKCGGTGYIIDASPLVTKHLFGLGCAGWSDCKAIQVRPVAKSTPTGPAGCVPQVPNVSIKIHVETIAGQARDTCKLQGSKGIFDWKVGQSAWANVELKNSGTTAAKGVKVGIERLDAALDISRWNIYSDWKHPGSFTLNDTDGMQSLPHASPGASLTLALHAISPGETKRVRLKLAATSATFPGGHARLQAWVRAISGYYSKTSYDAAPSNVGGHQKQNGGNLRARYLTDILEPERCDGLDNDCDGTVDEGGVCTQPAPPDSGAPTPDSGVPDTPVAPAPDMLVAADDLGGGFVEGDGMEAPSVWPEAAEVVGSCALQPGGRGAGPLLLLPLLLLAAIAGRRGSRRGGSRGFARRR